MKKILIIFLVIIVLSVLATLYSANPKVIISSLLSKGQLHPGELKYRIELLGILPIGEAVFYKENLEDYKGQSVYHLSATASSPRFSSRFFKSYAVLDSYVDTEHFNPILFKQKLVSPGKERQDKTVIYDQRNGIMVMDNVRRQILPNTQDPLSLVFNIRRMDFDKARTMEMNINTNQKNYVLQGKSETREILVGNKSYKIVIINAEIKRRDNNLCHKSNVRMILLKDKGNIPLSIKVFASGVIINAKLIEVQ